VFDYRALFESAVINPFTAAYRAGQTPNPCVLCNRDIKFGAFLHDALALGFNKIATGHWARVVTHRGACHIARASNRAKDQSYALCLLPGDAVARLILPLGDIEGDKQDLRQMAFRANLPVAHRPDSQDICFVTNGDHAGFIESRSGVCHPGRYLDESGKVLGYHKGICCVTVGQRKGLGIALGKPAFVSAVGDDGDVVLTFDESRLFTKTVWAKNAVFTNKTPVSPFAASVQIRYAHRAAPAGVTPTKDGRVRVDFTDAQRAPTPGQAIACSMATFCWARLHHTPDRHKQKRRHHMSEFEMLLSQTLPAAALCGAVFSGASCFLWHGWLRRTALKQEASAFRETSTQYRAKSGRRAKAAEFMKEKRPWQMTRKKQCSRLQPSV
jgi:tRNA-specific 2-thiouridylase